MTHIDKTTSVPGTIFRSQTALPAELLLSFPVVDLQLDSIRDVQAESVTARVRVGEEFLIASRAEEIRFHTIDGVKFILRAREGCDFEIDA